MRRSGLVRIARNRVGRVPFETTLLCERQTWGSFPLQMADQPRRAMRGLASPSPNRNHRRRSVGGLGGRGLAIRPSAALAFRMREPSRIPTAAAVGPRDDLKQMPVGILEIDTTSTVVVIDLVRLGLSGIGPVSELLVAD